MPACGNTARLGIAVVNHPTLSGCALVVNVTLSILADLLPFAPGKEARAERLAIPPGEELQKKVFHVKRRVCVNEWGCIYTKAFALKRPKCPVFRALSHVQFGYGVSLTTGRGPAHLLFSPPIWDFRRQTDERG